MKGWVYVLSNESLNGLIKIGFSTKDPENRAKELSGDTGVPTPFIVEYEALVDDPHGCEQKAHKLLSEERVNQKREFFQCTIDRAIETVKEVAGGEVYFEKYRNEPEGRVAVDDDVSLPLLGLIRYMTDDGDLTNHEIYHLCKWMNELPAECDLWPGTILIEPLNEVYADGVLTGEELQRIAMILATILREYSENSHRASDPGDESSTSAVALEKPPIIEPEDKAQGPQRRMAKERSGLIGGILQKYEQHNLDKAWRNELKQFDDKEKQRKRELYIEGILSAIQNGTHTCLAQGVFCKKNEKPLWAEKAVLCEDVVTKHYQSGSRGTSIRIARGISWKVGASRGRTVSEKSTVPVDEGAFVITDQRLIFSGNIKSFDVGLSKIINIQFHPDGIVFSQSSRKKRRIIKFPANNGDIVCAVLNQLHTGA